MNQKQKQDYHILIWVDSQIFNWENKLYCEQLQNDYQNAFQAFNDISQACELLQNIGEQDVTILTSGQHAYSLVKHTKQNIIVFCGRKQTHFDLFANNVQVKSIVSDSFQQAHEDAKMSMNQLDIQNEFIKLLSPPQKQVREYQHSKDHVSIQFLVVIEELRKNKKVKEPEVFADIENLLSIQKKQNLKFQIFQDLENKEKENLKQNKQKFKLFEKLIYFYTREEIGLTLNQQFAEHNYQQITNIILCLYKGFKKHQNQKNQFKILFRGILLLEEDIMRDLNQSKDQGTSLFWNTITSTSLSDEVALRFCSNYGILYQIILDEEIPHPCFKLQKYHSEYPDEKEVILFPQFEFIVQEIQQQQIKNNQIYTVTIKQVKNNYAFALDPMMRKTYWDSVVEKKIKPKIDALVDFQFKRIFEFLTFCADEKQKEEFYWRKFLSRIKEELENVFQQIQTQLTYIFNHSKYPDILSQIKNLTKTYIEVVKIEDQNQLAFHQYKLLEEHIHEVKEQLKLNICTLVLKGIIDIEQQLVYLQQLQQNFNKNQIIMINILTKSAVCTTFTFMRIGGIVGTPLGPIGRGIGMGIGIGIGMVIGGIIGGFLAPQFSINVNFSKENKSTVKDGYLLNPGKRPLIRWQCVKNKARSLILIGQTDTRIACLITNISRDKAEICPNEDVGIKFNQYKYRGPDDSSSTITFWLVATTHEYCNDHEVLQQLNMKQINIIDVAECKVNLRDIR